MGKNKPMIFCLHLFLYRETKKESDGRSLGLLAIIIPPHFLGKRLEQEGGGGGGDTRSHNFSHYIHTMRKKKEENRKYQR